ncbi:dihydroxyacetone kinase [Chelonobacter oris]|uniref:dihydroxyacetone kinase subunit DhaK n=1 Tax=Chelonobacter oris TaxID=505317 RepID=UPI0024482660|nr:dihydroxyacetone kinase subunit DhaK [Chelonobacter oris]MDH3000768.1 dihydroxyacetone kinase [Chelonobacter oris]
MKKWINNLENVLKEQISGLILSNPNLKLNAEPLYVCRADSPVDGKVAIISGGGSGHEPMHAGFVGAGMLDGACPGEIFTSPTPDQMVACASAVDSGRGVLLLIKNYTGDVLNFETAVEILHDGGTPVATVLIDDDVAVKDSLYTAGRRGVANTVLLEKILGAAAERGDSLAQLAELGARLNNAGHSIGVALAACTVPAAGKPSFTLAENEMEFGVGIHGEPGIERRPFVNLDQTVDQMFATLIENGGFERPIRHWDNQSAVWQEMYEAKSALQRGDRVIALVNNLGGVPLSELYGVYHRLTSCCSQFGLSIERNLVGAFCTSLDMQGVSITLLKVDDDILSLWDAPVNTAGLRWKA